METLAVYIPTDRRTALAKGAELPQDTRGAALFADISGFTPLTEGLVQALGPQRGAEELTLWLNKIYDALVAEIENHRGSVISFSGDAITCWFDDRESTSAAFRAMASALGIQQTMQQFAQVDIPGAGTVSLAIKVVITAGSAKRFLIGDPTIQLVDALAGETVYRLATAEHHAERGEILLDQPAVAVLGDAVNVAEWREDSESGERFAVVDQLRMKIEPAPWSTLEADTLTDEQVRPWLLPPIYERLISGMGEFLTELRPTVSFFLRFSGIDYDGDPDAQSKLNSYIQAVQRVLARYNSYMLQLTIGDKGSSFYAAFGAPLAHEDNAIRAVSAALELRDLHMDFISDVQIGISQGLTRTGACGGTYRRTYSAIGDEVNMAARLMQNAPLGQVLVNQNVHKATADTFMWEELPPLKVKGKSQPVIVFRLISAQERRGIRLHEPKYALPMVGRAAELSLIEQKLNLSLLGRGQIVGLTAEAGMGKSRLMAEIIRLSREHNMIGYGGECQSYGTTTSYLVWQDIWRGFFKLDPTWSVEKQIGALEQELREIDPALLPRLPLLGSVLNLPIPDNELTASFEAKLRKESLEFLLVDCVRIRARSMPLLFVLEDCHWLDPLSHDLLEIIGRAIVDLPVLMAIAYRPPQMGRLLTPRVTRYFHFTEIPLTDLPAEEIEQLVSLKLKQVYGEQARLPQALIEKISSRADGNPFYIEELLNYLRDRNIDPQQADVLEQVDLPDSLYTLILSRIDQLTENQKTLLKVASVIGRLFRAALLWGIYDQFGNQRRVQSDLDALSALDLTPLDSPEPELMYLFKHILTQEVTYETLSFATRAMLHDQIGRYIENTQPEMLDQYLDLLAFHFERSENEEKKREYLLKAAEAAQADYANATAITYYQRVLHLLPEDQRVGGLLKLGQVLELVGDWETAEQINREADRLALMVNDVPRHARAQRALGWLLRKRGAYSEAEEWLARARECYQQLNDTAGLSHVLSNIGEIYRLQGKYEEARAFYDESLNLAEQIAEQRDRLAARAHSLKGAGTVATWQGDYATGRALNEESLRLRRELGDTPGVATLLNNLGIIARFQRDLDGARQMNEESLTLFREMGDRWAVGQLLNNQACVASDHRGLCRGAYFAQ
ncbi:MAG: tetratricopeptide repeat protein [Anaerolineales bacterium]